MKYVNLLISFILTLSLSASVLCQSYSLNEDNPLVEDNNLVSEYNNISNNDLVTPKGEYVEVFSENNQQLYLTEADIYLMSQVVYAESKGEPFEGKVAVASVIINRVLSPRFPNTIQEVIFQPYAFSCIINGEITVEPSQECFEAVYEAIRGTDPTGDALFFYNPETATCSWMQNVEKCDTTAIGKHLFFSLAY